MIYIANKKKIASFLIKTTPRIEPDLLTKPRTEVLKGNLLLLAKYFIINI